MSLQNVLIPNNKCVVSMNPAAILQDVLPYDSFFVLFRRKEQICAVPDFIFEVCEIHPYPAEETTHMDRTQLHCATV
jgi:hypothetical protein